MDSFLFRSTVLIRLEHIGKKIVGPTFYDADELDSRAFCDGMITILSLLYKQEKEVLNRFVDMCNGYCDKPCSVIPDKEGKELFDEFIRLYHLKQDNRACAE